MTINRFDIDEGESMIEYIMDGNDSQFGLYTRANSSQDFYSATVLMLENHDYNEPSTGTTEYGPCVKIVIQMFDSTTPATKYKIEELWVPAQDFSMIPDTALLNLSENLFDDEKKDQADFTNTYNKVMKDLF